ncbi:MAG TPA: DUF6049 family protein, partial [Actinomycetota bacterium]|nr:DUF6049 family protein [Actinomycetota bacterium]
MAGDILLWMRLTAAWLLTLLCLTVVVAAGPAAATPAVAPAAAARAAPARKPAADPSPASSPGSSGSVSAKLLAFPAWFGPSTTITASIAVTNNTAKPVSNISIHMEVFGPARSRSDLGQQFDGKDLLDLLWADSEPFPDTIAPGQTTLFNFDLGKTPPAYNWFARQSPSLDRAYPVRFTVDVNAVPETSLLTEMVYFQEPQVATPLDLSLVIPLDTPTVLNPQGQETSRALESAIAPGGRIANILGALEAASSSGLRVALAPTGKLLDSLQVLASPTGFIRSTKTGSQLVPPTDPADQNAASALRAIQSLVARGTVRLIATPYSSAPLPGLVANGLSSEVNEQVSDGSSTVRSVLGPNVDTLQGWLLPTDGLVDDATVGQLVGLGVTNVILAPGSLQQPSSLPQLTPSAQ